MTDKTINQLTALGTTPASDDKIPVWDESASAYKYVTKANLVGGTLTGGGTVATGGFTLTVPSTGTAVTLTGTQTLTNKALDRAYSAYTDTIVDDAATSITVPVLTGVFLIACRFGNDTAARQEAFAFAAYRTSSPAQCTVLLQPASRVEATTGALAGTTGNDNVVTVSSHTDSKIYIENRTGSNIAFDVLFF